MVFYDYRCPSCGPFRLSLPMGSAAPAQPCRACGSPARRTMTAPALGGRNPALHRALSRQEASAHEPAVVSSVPPKATRPRPVNPLHSRLPKP